MHYPRKMRVGWCVAHEVTACGVAIERYGVKYSTYGEALKNADRMNLESGLTAQQEEEVCKKK